MLPVYIACLVCGGIFTVTMEKPKSFGDKALNQLHLYLLTFGMMGCILSAYGFA